MPIILILRPLEWFGIVGAELKRVVSLGQFMMMDGTVRSEQVDAQQEDLHELAELCEELRPDSLYARYANKKVFRHEEDFWATKEKAVRQHVKLMADKRIIKTVNLADKLDMLQQLVEEEQLSPSEYYNMVQASKPKQRKRAVGKLKNAKQEESEW